jgi:hypothetical protein
MIPGCALLEERLVVGAADIALENDRRSAMLRNAPSATAA